MYYRRSDERSNGERYDRDGRGAGTYRAKPSSYDPLESKRPDLRLQRVERDLKTLDEMGRLYRAHQRKRTDLARRAARLRFLTG